ncbi:glycosyltransferase family 2 protein [Candidatus Bathyarchaeota archaeon]|nr:glycosyltransferase family 2 protein [Candidatus Bathyarchaeota archaeon]
MRVVCVVPAYNEETTIGSVVKRARDHASAVLVVDDGSTDMTSRIAREAGGKVVTHIARLGVGAALSTGLSLALRDGAEIIVTLDADGQHDPDEIPNVIAPLLEKKADLVIGSRLQAENSQMPLYKKLGNKILSRLTSLACGTRVTDSQSGFRAFTREVAETIRYRSTDYGWASEMLILLSRRGVRMVDVPVKAVYFKKRVRGAGIKDAVKILYNILSPK